MTYVCRKTRTRYLHKPLDRSARNVLRYDTKNEPASDTFQFQGGFVIGRSSRIALHSMLSLFQIVCCLDLKFPASMVCITFAFAALAAALASAQTLRSNTTQRQLFEKVSERKPKDTAPLFLCAGCCLNCFGSFPLFFRADPFAH